MKSNLYAIALCLILALGVTSAFIAMAMWLNRYAITDIYIGAIWSFIILSILFLSILPSRVGRMARRPIRPMLERREDE